MPDRLANSITPNLNTPAGLRIDGISAALPKIPTAANIQSVSKSKDVVHLVDLVEDLRAITSTTDRRSVLIKQFMDAVMVRATPGNWLDRDSEKWNGSNRRNEVQESRDGQPVDQATVARVGP